MSDVLQAARVLSRAGLSIIPVSRDGSKRPAVAWKEYQSRRAEDGELVSWFSGPAPLGIGVVCGAVSGNLIVFDFEDRPAFDSWARQVNESEGGCLDSLPIAETPGGGRHVYYRSAGAVPAGSKLAYRRSLEGGDLDLIFETRGEGHYVIAPGSPADCHESGQPYKWIRKGWAGG